MSRATLGAERVATPLTEAYRALYAALERKGWADGNWDPVSYYYDRMICNWLLQLIDNALSDAQLEAVQPAQVHLIVLLLFRDMFRHQRALLWPANSSADWVDPLFLEIASDLRLPVDSLQDNGQPYELEDLENVGWAASVGSAFGLPAEKLFVCHGAIVTGITEEFGSRPFEGNPTPTTKPWWRFW